MTPSTASTVPGAHWRVGLRNTKIDPACPVQRAVITSKDTPETSALATPAAPSKTAAARYSTGSRGLATECPSKHTGDSGSSAPLLFHPVVSQRIATKMSANADMHQHLIQQTRLAVLNKAMAAHGLTQPGSAFPVSRDDAGGPEFLLNLHPKRADNNLRPLLQEIQVQD
ncbi:hypothetical protein PF008_g25679 [Phytophthora fragariae]|uniref:Uncharacterized protein n=1 Tax=Phytophthora fragariae TaxID=53985 RepID=A0A6G0QK69_9STRA|nr:hypothetical protein PF008_g25679 [Phytophthora fragariae]